MKHSLFSSRSEICLIHFGVDGRPSVKTRKEFRFFSLQQSNQDSSQAETQGETEYAVVGTVNDRSFLSDEMAAMCAKLPIYRIKQRNLPVQRKLNNVSTKKIHVDKIFKSISLSFNNWQQEWWEQQKQKLPAKTTN